MGQLKSRPVDLSFQFPVSQRGQKPNQMEKKFFTKLIDFFSSKLCTWVLFRKKNQIVGYKWGWLFTSKAFMIQVSLSLLKVLAKTVGPSLCQFYPFKQQHIFNCLQKERSNRTNFKDNEQTSFGRRNSIQQALAHNVRSLLQTNP